MPTGMLAWFSSASLSSAVMKSRTGSFLMCSMSMNTIVLYTTGEKALAAVMNEWRSWNMHASEWIFVPGSGALAAFFRQLITCLHSSPLISISSGNADHSVVSSVRLTSRRSSGPSAHCSAERSMDPGVPSLTMA